MEKRTYELFKNLQERHWWFVGRRKILLTILDSLIDSKPIRILDVGCGTGVMVKYFGQFGEIWGVDSSKEAVEACRKENLPNVYLDSQFHMREEFVDLITCLDVIEHIEDDVGFLKRYVRYLKKDGALILTAPAYKFLWSDHDVVNHHKRRYSKRELVELVLALDFKIQKVTYFNTFLFPPIALIRILHKIKRTFIKVNVDKMDSDFEFVHNYLDTILSWVFASERYLLKNHRFPFGVSLLCIARK
ncbi:MAG: class I SAM-dependent methyltransferase [bacterium]